MKCINKKCSAELANGSIYCHICGKRQEPEPRKHIKRANGTGTVYKLSGRRRRPWVAARSGIILNYYETKTEAQNALNESVKRPISERYNYTLAEVYELWSKEHFRDIRSKDGVQLYKTAYNHFKVLHDTKFRDIHLEHYQKIIDDMTSNGKLYSAAQKLKVFVNQICKWAMREDIIQKNYAEFLKIPKKEKKEREIFTKADRDKLWKSNNDAAKIILMLIYTGMRIGELFHLPKENVHDQYCIGGSKTEAGKNRVIPIPPEVKKYFDYFKSRSSKILIDGYAGNKFIDDFRRRDYYDVLKKLGISKKPPHSTRHTYASMAREIGMRPEVLQKILGHAKYSTTADIYVHTDVDALVAAAEKIAGNKRVTDK